MLSWRVKHRLTFKKKKDIQILPLKVEDAFRAVIIFTHKWIEVVILLEYQFKRHLLN